MTVVDALLILAAYLIGSLSAAIIVCRVMGLPDPRTEGSKNPGATNVLRLGGKKAAAITLVGDMVKGLLPVVAARALTDSPQALALVGLAAFLGHLFPLFFGFKGGKGVATSLGVMLGLAWPVALTTAVTWWLMARLFKISSLAALTAAILAPLYFWLLRPELSYVVMMAVISALLLWRHKSNIQRLLAGTEPRIGKKAEGN